MALAKNRPSTKPKSNTVLVSALIATLVLSGCSKESEDEAANNAENAEVASKTVESETVSASSA